MVESWISGCIVETVGLVIEDEAVWSRGVGVGVLRSQCADECRQVTDLQLSAQAALWEGLARSIWLEAGPTIELPSVLDCERRALRSGVLLPANVSDRWVKLPTLRLIPSLRGDYFMTWINKILTGHDQFVEHQNYFVRLAKSLLLVLAWVVFWLLVGLVLIFSKSLVPNLSPMIGIYLFPTAILPALFTWKSMLLVLKSI